jgi:hypothetical protein
MRQTRARGGGRYDPSGIPEKLRQSYTRAIYRVDARIGPIFLRVGETHPELDRWLSEQGAPRFAFLTAANPGSKKLSGAENERRLRQLRERLDAMGHGSIPGESFDEVDGGFREASFLVFAIGRDDAIALARDFGQLALLYGESGRPVELVWTLSPGSGEARL